MIGVAGRIKSFSRAATSSAKTMRARLPPIETIGQNTPLRVGVAAALALPDGAMTASGLRDEAES
jgi:hypothetical protein